MSDMPTAQKFLNFTRYMPDMIGDVVGPNTLGEYLTCVETVFDPATNTTRAGYAYGIYKVSPEDLTTP